MSLKFNFQRDIWSGAIAMHMADKTDAGFSAARQIVFSKLDIGSYADPVVKLSPEEAQGMMDALYEAGVRPAAAAGSVGQLKAVAYHLEDMRALVFKRGPKQ